MGKFLTLIDFPSLLAQSRPIVSNNMNWTAYHGLSDIYGWLNTVLLRDPKYVRGFTVGRSYEGRPIRGFKISKKPGNKAIFIDSNIHAIEWISSAVGTCFFENLLNSEDPEMQALSEDYDWFYVPVVNPDGFVYSHEVVSQEDKIITSDTI